jgi:hypothetical protein
VGLLLFNCKCSFQTRAYVKLPHLKSFLVLRTAEISGYLSAIVLHDVSGNTGDGVMQGVSRALVMSGKNH